MTSGALIHIFAVGTGWEGRNPDPLPQPNGPKRLSPDDLARQVAARLADAEVPKRRVSVRDSVLLGRVLSLGSYLLLASVVGVAGWLGVGWLMGDGSTGDSEVLGVTAFGPANGAEGSVTPGNATDPFGQNGLLAVTSPVLVAPGGAFGGPGLPSLPLPTSTTLASGASTTSTVASNIPTTTQPSASSTSAPLPPATLPPPTTTTTQQSTTTSEGPTTTIGPTTTTIPNSTTTAPSTSTTCGNNGNGKGNCG